MMKNGRGRIIDRRVVECSVAKTWFDEIARGRKTIEGRIPKPGGKFAAIAPGDVLMISDATGGHPHHKSSPTRVKAVVVDVRTYASFEGYLESEGVRRTLPRDPLGPRRRGRVQGILRSSSSSCRRLTIGC